MSCTNKKSVHTYFKSKIFDTAKLTATVSWHTYSHRTSQLRGQFAAQSGQCLFEYPKCAATDRSIFVYYKMPKTNFNFKQPHPYSHTTFTNNQVSQRDASTSQFVQSRIQKKCSHGRVTSFHACHINEYFRATKICPKMSAMCKVTGKAANLRLIIISSK